MSEKRFKKGDTAYTISGNEVEFIAEVGGQAIVRQVLHGDDEEPHYGRAIEVRELFKSPPVEKHTQIIADLLNKIAELSAQKKLLESELFASQKDGKERKDRIMQNAALARIDDFLTGKFTHFVYYLYEVRIVSFDDAVRYKENSQYDKVPNRMRLLALYGKAEGNLEWGLHSYSDGSGSPDWVIPCSSLEHAQEVAKEKIELGYAEWRSDPSRDYALYRSANAAEKLGFEIPEDAAAVIDAKRTKSLVEARDKAYLELEKAEVALATGIPVRKGK